MLIWPALLRQKSKLRIVQAALPCREPEDRLVTINPAMFDLDPLLVGLKKSLPTTAVYGLRFLSDSVDNSSEHRAKSVVSLVARYEDVCKEVAEATESAGVEFLGNLPTDILRVDENGVQITVGKHAMHPRALIVAGHLPTEFKAMLGMPLILGARHRASLHNRAMQSRQAFHRRRKSADAHVAGFNR